MLSLTWVRAGKDVNQGRSLQECNSLTFKVSCWPGSQARREVRGLPFVLETRDKHQDGVQEIASTWNRVANFTIRLSANWVFYYLIIWGVLWSWYKPNHTNKPVMR